MFPNPTSSVSFQGLSFGPEQEGTPFPLGEDKGHFRTVVVITPRSDSLNVGKAEICRLFVCNLVRWQLGRSILLFLSSECYLPSLLFVLGYTFEATLPFWSAVKQIPFGSSQIPLSLPDIQPPPTFPSFCPLPPPCHLAPAVLFPELLFQGWSLRQTFRLARASSLPVWSMEGCGMWSLGKGGGVAGA